MGKQFEALQTEWSETNCFWYKIERLLCHELSKIGVTSHRHLEHSLHRPPAMQQHWKSVGLLAAAVLLGIAAVSFRYNVDGPVDLMLM